MDFIVGVFAGFALAAGVVGMVVTAVTLTVVTRR